MNYYCYIRTIDNNIKVVCLHITDRDNPKHKSTQPTVINKPLNSEKYFQVHYNIIPLALSMNSNKS